MNLSRPSSLLLWFTWHLLAAAAIVFIPLLLRFRAISNLDTNAVVFFIGLAIAYLVSVVVFTLYTAPGRKIRFTDLTATYVPIFAALFLALLFYQPVYSRGVIILSLILVLVCTLLSLGLRPALFKLALYVVAAIIPLAFLTASITNKQTPERKQTPEVVVRTKVINTGFYNFIVHSYPDFLGLQEVTGGGISKFHDRYLLATGDGQLHILRWDAGMRKLESRKLPHRVPLNRDEFDRDTAQTKKIRSGFFRTADILVQDFGEDFRLFASHHYWNSQRKCFTVRISATRGKYSVFLSTEEPQNWQTVYETKPCLSFKNKKHPFAGHQIGGKLVQFDSHRLLMAVGDHEFDGVGSEEILPQNDAASYGKTVLINTATGATSIYSKGHRNPQGLHIDASGNIWETEHGPKGGDELNLILRGRNYGWPLVTFGTDYTKDVWPLNAHQGRHDGFELPTYAWTPSIGISGLISVRSNPLDIWKGDLLVGSLADGSIWRVRVQQGKTVFTERINIGARIRDMLEDDNGILVLQTEQSFKPPTRAGIVIVEPVVKNHQTKEAIHSRKGRGELLFAQCIGCHKLEDGNVQAMGPNLKGVFQRRIAGARDYAYSEALKGISGKWTEEKLDAFLGNPQRFAPGTLMQSEEILDSAERADLIEYLKTLK
jgi:cytochrome c2